jgi:hypothetical protein
MITIRQNIRPIRNASDYQEAKKRMAELKPNALPHTPHKDEYEVLAILVLYYEEKVLSFKKVLVEQESAHTQTSPDDSSQSSTSLPEEDMEAWAAYATEQETAQSQVVSKEKEVEVNGQRRKVIVLPEGANSSNKNHINSRRYPSPFQREKPYSDHERAQPTRSVTDPTIRSQLLEESIKHGTFDAFMQACARTYRVRMTNGECLAFLSSCGYDVSVSQRTYTKRASTKLPVAPRPVPDHDDADVVIK